MSHLNNFGLDSRLFDILQFESSKTLLPREFFLRRFATFIFFVDFFLKVGGLFDND